MEGEERGRGGAFTGACPEQEVLSAWQTPGPGEEQWQLRPKRFKIVRLEGGRLALCKADSAAEYVAHEAKVLEALEGVDCVPGLLCWTDTSLYTSYVEGKLLPEAIRDLGLGACLGVGWQVLAAVAKVHRRGVVHADIRPWNFIYGDDGCVYVIDFEYAYLRTQEHPPALLDVHHVAGLRTAWLDWIDACRAIADLWRTSAHRLVRSGLSLVPLAAHWALRAARIPGLLRARLRR